MITANSYAESIELKSGQKKNTMIELFTSEGCSSCPPAEHWINGLKNHPKLWDDIIPVAFHVDYWDYIGWKDPFATPGNSYRQRRYHQEKGIKSVYTPGFVTNGYEWRRWFNNKTIIQSDVETGELNVSIHDGLIKAEYKGKEVEEMALKINVAVLGFGLETEIKAGENAGRTLHHDFVVVGQDNQTSFNGQWTLPIPDVQKHEMTRQGIAVWISPINRQKPIQSVGGWL